MGYYFCTAMLSSSDCVTACFCNRSSLGGMIGWYVGSSGRSVDGRWRSQFLKMIIR